MANVLYISKYNDTRLCQHEHVPRIGEKVDLFYNPFPKVVDIIWYPLQNTLTRYGIAADTNIDAIVVVE